MPGRFTGSVLGPHRPRSEGNLAGDLENKDPQAVTTLPEQDKTAEEPRTAAPAPKPAASATESGGGNGEAKPATAAPAAGNGSPAGTSTEKPDAAAPGSKPNGGAARGEGQGSRPPRPRIAGEKPASDRPLFERSQGGSGDRGKTLGASAKSGSP